MASEKYKSDFETELGNYFRRQLKEWIQSSKNADQVIDIIKQQLFTKVVLDNFYLQYNGPNLTIPLTDPEEAKAFKQEMLAFRELQAKVLASTLSILEEDTRLIIEAAKNDITQGKFDTEKVNTFVNHIAAKLGDKIAMFLLPTTIMVAMSFSDDSKKDEQERQKTGVCKDLQTKGGLSEIQAKAVINYLHAVDPIILGAQDMVVEAARALKMTGVEGGKEIFLEAIRCTVKYQYNKVDAYLNGELGRLQYRGKEEIKKGILEKNLEARWKFEENIKNEELLSHVLQTISQPEPKLTSSKNEPFPPVSENLQQSKPQSTLANPVSKHGPHRTNTLQNLGQLFGLSGHKKPSDKSSSGHSKETPKATSNPDLPSDPHHNHKSHHLFWHNWTGTKTTTTRKPSSPHSETPSPTSHSPEPPNKRGMMQRTTSNETPKKEIPNSTPLQQRRSVSSSRVHELWQQSFEQKAPPSSSKNPFQRKVSYDKTSTQPPSPSVEEVSEFFQRLVPSLNAPTNNDPDSTKRRSNSTPPPPLNY